MKHDVRAREAWTRRGNHALLSFLHQQSPVLETLPEISPPLSKHDVPDQLTSFVFLSLMQGNRISPMHPISENQGKKQDTTCKKKKNVSARKQNIFLYQGIIVDSIRCDVLKVNCSQNNRSFISLKVESTLKVSWSTLLKETKREVTLFAAVVVPSPRSVWLFGILWAAARLSCPALFPGLFSNSCSPSR